LEEILRTGFRGAPIGWQVGSNLGLGATCFCIAWALFDRCADQAVEGASLGGGSGVRPLRRATARRGRPWRHPLVWKDFHYVVGGLRVVWIKFGVCVGIVGLLAWGAIESGNVEISFFGYVIMFVMTVAWTADLAISASRIFRVEMRGQTLSSLAALPFSLGTIARQKALGCLLASWPAMLVFFGAFAVSAPDILRWLKPWELGSNQAVTNEFTGFCLGVALTLAAIAFFVHLVAWLSLRVKFGALPLAMVISFVGTQMAGFAFAFIFAMNFQMSGEVVLSLVVIFLLLGAASLHATIARRLEKHAAAA